MRKLSTVIAVVMLSTALWSQSGFIGNRFFADASLMLDPLIDFEYGFSPGVSAKLGYCLSDRSSLAVEYSITSRNQNDFTIDLSSMTLDYYITRYGYVAPMGKSWIIGLSKVTGESIEVRTDRNDVETRVSRDVDHLYLRLGHESRLPIKSSNFYVMTQILYQIVLANGGEGYAQMGIEGKIGAGIFF